MSDCAGRVAEFAHLNQFVDHLLVLVALLQLRFKPQTRFGAADLAHANLPVLQGIVVAVLVVDGESCLDAEVGGLGKEVTV